MERLREEILSNTGKLQSVVHEITIRLNSIVQQNLKLSKLNLPEKDQCSKIIPCQHTIIDFLLSFNVQLEELQTEARFQLRVLTANESSKPQSPLEKNKKFEHKKHRKSNSSNVCTQNEIVLSSSDNPVIETYTYSSKVVNGTSRKPKTVRIETPDMKCDSDLIDLNSTDRDSSQDNQWTECLTNYNIAKETKIKDISENSVNPKNMEPPKIKIFDDLSHLNFTKQDSSEVRTKNNDVDLDNEIFKGTLPTPMEPSLGTQCVISYVKDPSELYIQIDDESLEEVEKISNDFAENRDNKKGLFLTKAIAKEKISRFCLCYLNNHDFWYRAEIVNWMDSDKENVLLYFIDFGFQDYASYKNIKPLLNKHAKVPQCAIKCHLVYLYPPNHTIENPTYKWPKKTVERFHQIIAPLNSFIYKIEFAELFNDSWGIELVKLSNEDMVIGQTLLDEKLCVELIPSEESEPESNGFIVNQIKTARGTHGISSDMSDNEQLEVFYSRTNVKEARSLEEAVSGYKARDEARTCGTFLRHGKCYKLPNCKLDHTPLRQDGFTTDKVKAHIETKMPAKLPNVGEIIDVRITSISSLTLWYGHVISNLTAYENLLANLNNPKKTYYYKQFEVTPSLGELVIVKTNGPKDRWRRARVLEIYSDPTSPKEMARLFLVDTGETIESKLNDLRVINDELVYPPFQAVPLKLSGLKETDNGMRDVIAYCESTFLSKNFKATILPHEFSSMLSVRLTKNCEDVSQKIIRDGYGEPIEEWSLDFKERYFLG